MVMKMNTTESTMTEVISQQALESASTITIALHPQPKNLDLVCDSHSAVTGETTLSLTNMSPTSSDSDSLHQTQLMVKRSLKLDLNQNDDERVESLESGSPNNNEGDQLSKSPRSPRSPMSPGRSARAGVTHQTSVNSVEPVDDRKALRDALYQGIFHRHRRTIFAVGSFLRMLKSRNSQYNTIRSTSEDTEKPT